MKWHEKTMNILFNNKIVRSDNEKNPSAPAGERERERERERVKELR